MGVPVSPLFLFLLYHFPSPASYFSFGFYQDLSCLTLLLSPASPSLYFFVLLSLSTLFPSLPSSEPPGSPFHLPARPWSLLPREARWCLCGALSMGQLPGCRPCCPGCPGGQGAGPRGGRREEGGSTWLVSRQGKGVAGRASWHQEGTWGETSGPEFGDLKRNRIGERKGMSIYLSPTVYCALCQILCVNHDLALCKSS